MFKINQITNNAKQNHTLQLPVDGTPIILRLYYSNTQKGWFIDELFYTTITGPFTVKGVRITNGLNILYQFKNKLPFGLACLSKFEREPTLQDDFLSGNSELFLLTSEEVQQYADFISG